MIIVIQCAAGKRADAGHFRTRDGRQVLFVAEPSSAPALDGMIYARPDDFTTDGRTWRDEILAYNVTPDGNPFDLKPAFELYQNETYRKLAAKVGPDKLFILSAGWGLIAASFLTPNYDITFSPQADNYKRRRKKDRYQDISMVPAGADEPILFFGGKDYLPLFDRLTVGTHGPRIVFFNSVHSPTISNGRAVKFATTTKTNWHYECANSFLTGALDREIDAVVQ